MKIIPQSEILQCKEILMNYFDNSENRGLIELLNNPIEILRGLKIKIMDRIDFINSRRLSRSIKTLIRNIIRKPKKAFKKYSNCLACKTALRIILFAFASVIGIAISSINRHFTDITTLLSEFFEKSFSEIDAFLKNYGFQVMAFNLFDLNDLIEKLCEEYGFC
ncbi:hypothetical protein [Winogradskyella sp.]|uniref:hypothetical protein n=1 Tax=Winogradskyella sp. TaxID=1883156 RepID=UPI003AB8BF4C